MRKLLSYLWLPITAATILVFLYGALTMADLKNKNQNLEQKQNEIQVKVAQLEKDWGNLTVQAAGVKEEKLSKSGRVLATTDQISSETGASIATPTPIPTPSSKKTSTPRPTSTSPAPTPTPTFIPSPTPTPTPTPTPVSQASVTIESVGTYEVNLINDDTAFAILLRAGQENGFSVEYQMYEGLGAFVTCIAGICAHDNYYWAFYYNGSYSDKGASSQPVFAGDTTAWKFESF